MITAELGIPTGDFVLEPFGGLLILPAYRRHRGGCRGPVGGRPGRFPELHPHGTGGARAGRRPSGRAFGRHFAADDLGAGVVHRRGDRACHRHRLGQSRGRVLCVGDHRLQGAAGSDAWRAGKHHRRDRRRAAYRCAGKSCSKSTGARRSWVAIPKAGLHSCWRSPSCCSRRRACSARRSSSGSEGEAGNALSHRRTVQDQLSRRSGAVSGQPGCMAAGPHPDLCLGSPFR